jgi:hypothetical protein
MLGRRTTDVGGGFWEGYGIIGNRVFMPVWNWCWTPWYDIYMLACMVVWYGDSQRSMFDVGDISAGLALPSMLSGFSADAAK